MDEITPPVYGGIIDDIGRRQYSGNITWLREYIQNAIDSGSNSIGISLHGNDFEIVDHGKGMDQDSLVNQAFSIGKSFKDQGEIGELGIGMYAGSGICDTISVYTKMKGKQIYLATVDMSQYREIIRNEPKTTYSDMMKKIFQVNVTEEEVDNIEKSESFTRIRFDGLNRDTINLIEQNDLIKFLEYTMDLPISESFKHKEQLGAFINDFKLEIGVSLDINGTIRTVSKFESGSIDFTDTFWGKDIKDDSGYVIGKLWAVYNKSGASLNKARILVKKKGLTVGDHNYVESKFDAKYSPRFFGEIILLDDRVEINTSRDWFVSSTYLTTFIEKTRSLLNELYGIAEFDSRIGVGIINLAKTNARLDNRAIINEKKKNVGLAVEERDKIQRNKNNILDKLARAQEFKANVDLGKIDISDPTYKVKSELVERTLNDPAVKPYLEAASRTSEGAPVARKPRRNAWPTIVITFLKGNIIDAELAAKIGNGDVKDTTDRVFTYIEQKLKALLGKKENEYVEWKDLMDEFKRNFNPPDLKGFDIGDYMKAFNGIMYGTHMMFRNKSNHSFMEDMDNPRNTLEIILISDFIVHWLDQWTRK